MFMTTNTCPFTGWNNNYNGFCTPFTGWNNNYNGFNTPFTGWNNTYNGFNTPFTGWSNGFEGPFAGWNNPFFGSTPNGFTSEDTPQGGTNSFYTGAYGFGDKMNKTNVA